MKKTQKEMVLDHLQGHGYITKVVANVYGITDLRKYISVLRAEGHPIGSAKKRDLNGRLYTYYEYRDEVAA